MSRVKFSEGQEVLKDDLNALQAMREQELYDRLIYEMLQRGANGFIGASMLVSRTNSTTVSVGAGCGFQTDNTQTGSEPTKRLVYLSAASSQSIAAAHASLNRIDIVCIKANRADTATESRRYKANTTSLPTTQSFVTKTDWAADVSVVTGTPNASPTAPSTPSGYIRIASVLVTAVTGVGVNGVTDERTILDSVNLGIAHTWTGLNTFEKELILKYVTRSGVSNPSSGYKKVYVDENGIPVEHDSSGNIRTLGHTGIYDAIVGSAAYCNYATLALALAGTSAGARILVVSDQTITDLAGHVDLNKNNQLWEFAPGVTITKAGTATKGLIVSGSGVRIRGARFSGFTTGIELSTGALLAFITECRFASCTTEISDLSTTQNHALNANLTE